MLKRAIALSLGMALMLAHSIAFASDSQEAGKAASHTPDLTKSCAKECPNAASNDDALKCVEDMEKSQGEAAFKKKHRSCYSAHEKYEKQTGKEEAGEAGEQYSSQQ